MVKKKQTKALPGKRFCKQCEEMIPIHSRICGFCQAPQYTIQQIAKEYKKRLKAITDDDVLDRYKTLFTQDNPFITSLKHTEMYFEDFTKDFEYPKTLRLNVNGESKDISYLEAQNFGKISVLNTGGDVTSMSWAYSSTNTKYLAISTLPYDQK